ncbi:MAG: ATP-binding protein [Pseudomonadota bacterium]
MLLKNNSLLANLVLRISLVSIVSIIVLSGIVYSQIDRTLESLRDQTVEEQAKNIATYLKPSKGINRVFLDMPKSLRQFYAKAGETYQYMVRDEEGNLLFTSPIAFADYLPRDFSKVGDEKFEFTGPIGRKFVGFTMPVDIADKNLYIQVAQTRASADTFSDEITSVFFNRLLWVGLPFYCGLLIVIVWTLRRGLRPLHQAAEEVGKMSISDLGLRIKEEQVPSEVLPLVQSVNSSFSRLEQSIREQKELTENVAHELRTPLTILKTRIDTLDRNDETVKLSHDIDAMIKQLNQMLDVTRLEYADTMEKSSVDLAEVLSQACRDFFPLFIKAQRELTVSGVDKPVFIMGNKDLIYRAICNLLDNALEYSPAKTPVDASLKNYTIKITDYGRKILEQRRRIIFERFHKDSSPSARKSGAGLGLSIVARTMEVHGGYADLEKTGHKGNTFRMIFK